jgi:hypothetical protein
VTDYPVTLIRPFGPPSAGGRRDYFNVALSSFSALAGISSRFG